MDNSGEELTNRAIRATKDAVQEATEREATSRETTRFSTTTTETEARAMQNLTDRTADDRSATVIRGFRQNRA